MGEVEAAAYDAQTCTIVGELVGVRTAPCGQVAAHTVTGNCRRGHHSRRPICAEHAAAFVMAPGAVYCQQCDQVGGQTLMYFAITEGAEYE